MHPRFYKGYCKLVTGTVMTMQCRTHIEMTLILDPTMFYCGYDQTHQLERMLQLKLTPQSCRVTFVINVTCVLLSTAQMFLVL